MAGLNLIFVDYFSNCLKRAFKIQFIRKLFLQRIWLNEHFNKVLLYINDNLAGKI